MIFEIRDGNPNLMADPLVKRWHDMMASGRGVEAASEMINAQSNNRIPAVMKDPKLALSIWKKNTSIMEKYNEPGRFTAFIGYEWTSNAGGGDNLHRNVIYRDGKDKADQVLPMTTFDSENPEDLWKWMAAWEEKTGGSLLAIPHNGNLSNGKMFALQTFAGQSADARMGRDARAVGADVRDHPDQGRRRDASVALAERRVRQFRKMGPGQPRRRAEAARHDRARICASRAAGGSEARAVARREPVQVRLRRAAPTRHTGLTTAEEDNFFGKHTGVEPSPHRWEHAVIKTPQVNVKGWQMAAAGYTGVWATENTREAIWDALKRKEAYSTTGPRMIVRFFGGWDFDAKDAQTRMPAEAGYAKGVPMGGDLRAGPRREVTDFPRRRPQGPAERQPRSHPDHQGLGRRKRRAAGEGLRRGLVGRPQGRAPTASCRRSATPWTSRTPSGPTRSARPN